MKKRGQHYVWRHYLKPWSNNELIWSYIDGKICNTNLKNIGKSRDFYKLKELTANDIQAIIILALSHNNKDINELNKSWIVLFNMIFKIKRFAEHNGLNNAELNKLIDEAINNIEEDFHCNVENGLENYIKSILNKDIAFYKTDQDRAAFTHYICIQYMRTRKILENFIAVESKPPFTKFPFTVDFNKIFGVLRQVFATNISFGIFIDKSFHMVLLKNESPFDLITGDQPVINTYAAGLAINKSVEDLELYYPVSPKLAILITKREEFIGVNEIILNESKVTQYNKYIIEQSHSQVYAKSEITLREYLTCAD